jgi:hypothetical protein
MMSILLNRNTFSALSNILTPMAYLSTSYFPYMEKSCTSIAVPSAGFCLKQCEERNSTADQFLLKAFSRIIAACC